MFPKKYIHLQHFKPYFKKQGRLFAPLFLFMITGSSLGVVLSYLSSQQLVAISDMNSSRIVRFTLLILLAVLTHHTAWYLWTRTAAIISNRVAQAIRQDIIKHTLATRYLALKRHSTGYYLERLNDDANNISLIVSDVMGIWVDLFTNSAFLVIIYMQSWPCGLVFTLGVIGLYLIDLVKIRVELKHTQKQKTLLESLNSAMSETIRGAMDIKELGIKPAVAARCETISAALTACNIRMRAEVVFLERCRTLGQWLIDILLVLMCAVWLFPQGKITAVVLLIVLNYRGLMYETIGYVSQIKKYYEQGELRAARILEVIGGQDAESFGGQSLAREEIGITVQDLDFAYEGAPILTDVSFTLAPRTATVLLGASGSGKSTLFGLICRLYDPERGQILLGGMDAKQLTEESLTHLISVVSQEPFLFCDTILRNLTIVRPDADMEDVKSACIQAGIYGEIMSMKDGFDTCLTEGGSNLSGGQKQRLAIARAILKDTPVILFDEPTSALDQENQALFIHTLTALKRRKTLFVIAHKLTELSPFDQVLEMDRGSIRKVR